MGSGLYYALFFMNEWVLSSWIQTIEETVEIYSAVDAECWQQMPAVVYSQKTNEHIIFYIIFSGGGSKHFTSLTSFFFPLWALVTHQNHYFTIAAACSALFMQQLSFNLRCLYTNREMAVCFVCSQVIYLTTRSTLSQYLIELSSSGLMLEHLMRFNQHSVTGLLVTDSFCVISYHITVNRHWARLLLGWVTARG